MNDTEFHAQINIDFPKLSQIPALKALWQEAFGDSAPFIDSFFETAFSRQRCRCITSGNVIASALYWFDCSYSGGRIAYLYAVATAKTHRGNGFCHILMENTHILLKKLGYTCSVLVPGDKGLFDFYTGLGYKLFGKIRKFSAASSEKAAEIRQINAKEYTKLRKDFLPEGAVIQENENISFLKMHASFYTGDSFLIAGQNEDGRFLSSEFLGDTSAASEILKALGCKTGSFRTPGEDLPFAMYYPISDDFKTPPTYFGLAFD